VNTSTTVFLCKNEGCRLEKGHAGNHNEFPRNVWNFLNDKDKKKITKAGFATPRGGDKGAYQNHVSRSSKVIIPYEKLDEVKLTNYQDGYVIKLFPTQCFNENGKIKKEILSQNVNIGENAFVLYRSHDDLRKYPVLQDWGVRELFKDGERVERRGRDVEDVGHYVLRIPAQSPDPARNEGYPQGIFAPEYANEETNFLSQMILVWLIVKTENSLYNDIDIRHLEAILSDAGIFDIDDLEKKGVIQNNITSCPLCLNIINYDQLHKMYEIEDEDQLANAGMQVFGTTRSTDVNLFHITPLLYSKLEHIPTNICWGHASCNTKLGQMECIPLEELEEKGKKILTNEKKVVGWISKDGKIIRSSKGETWIKISDGKKSSAKKT